MKRLRRSRRTAVLTIAILGALGGGASAYFTATGTGTAAALVGTLDAPSNVTATAASGGATVTWDAPSAQTAPPRYSLLRNTSGATPAPVCDTTTSTSCTDPGLPDGTYTYTVVAEYRSFSAGADSNAVTVRDDSTAPAVTLTPPANAPPATTTIGGAAGNPAGDPSTMPVKIHDGTGTAGTGTVDTGTAGTGTAVIADQTPSLTGDRTGPAAAAPSDLAKPALRTLQMFDSDANGKIDEVKATFSETLEASNATAPWTLTNVPSGGSLGAVSTSGTGATLSINEGDGGADTSVGSFKVALAASPRAIRDSDGDQAGFVATTPSDLAGPVLMTATSDSGTTTNLMQAGDTLALTFSEALDPSSVPASPDVTESRSSSAGTLTIPGLISPTPIGFEYLDDSGDSATSSTTAALTGQTVTATLGTLTTNGAAAAGSGGASVFPAASLKDPAGNAAASAAPAIARLVSPLF